MRLITGERIQFLCDHFVGREKDLKFNPNVLRLHKEKCLVLDSINESVNNKYRIFCYTGLLSNAALLISKLQLFVNPFVLVFHNSDANFESKHMLLLDGLKNLRHIYAQNANIVGDKTTPLPIGLANSQWAHGDLGTFEKIMNEPLGKEKGVYFNFRVNTNPSKRRLCYNAITKKGIKWVPNKTYSAYLTELKKHQFCICPEGNGIDTHRFWECLYLDVIPVCKKNVLTEYYSKYFPVVLLNEWDDFDESQIVDSLENMIGINKGLLDLDHLERMLANNPSQ